MVEQNIILKYTCACAVPARVPCGVRASRTYFEFGVAARFRSSCVPRVSGFRQIAKKQPTHCDRASGRRRTGCHGSSDFAYTVRFIISSYCNNAHVGRGHEP